MKKRLMIIAVTVLILIIAAGLYIYFSKSNGEKEYYQFAQVEKGDIKTTVSCTGTIDAQKTVLVGTQVSGTVSKIYVDYNTKVKRGQILARLDTTLLAITVTQAEANLAKANSQYQVDLKNYENNLELNKGKLISDYDLEKLKNVKDQDYANFLSASSELQKAKANLDYAVIRSPIDGIVLERSIEEGQTVAASLSAPTLFTIAEDLTNIQINALVTEDDIGQVKIGQNATFTVQAYPEESFTGAVNDIYLKPTVQSNVVNYTVVIFAKNKKNLLLPGMTATLDIVSAEKKDIFMIANSALKYKPSDKILKEIADAYKNEKKAGNSNSSASGSQENNSSAKSGSNSSRRQGGQRDQSNSSRSGNSNNKNSQDPGKARADSNMARLWYVDKDNKIKFIPVRTGLNNGTKTEISNEKLSPDMKFINGMSKDKKTESTTNQNRNPGPNQMRRLF